MRGSKFRWSRVYESTEEELRQFLTDRGITAERVHIDEFARTQGVVSSTDTTLFCVEGSMTVVIGDQRLAAQAGDALSIGTNETYYIDAGFSGCTYYIAT